MITQIPTVDHNALPLLAQLIKRYASRYEYRLDGSSMWEGRVRDPMLRPSLLEQLKAASADATAIAQLERLSSYPALALPDSYELLLAPNPLVSYYCCDHEQAIVGVQHIDLFVIHHPDTVQYAWELNRITTEAGLHHRPRDLFDGFGFTIAHRKRLVSLGKCWK